MVSDLIGLRAEIKAKYDEAVASRDTAKADYAGLAAKVAHLEEVLQIIEEWVSPGEPLGRRRRQRHGYRG